MSNMKLACACVLAAALCGACLSLWPPEAVSVIAMPEQVAK